VFCKYEAVLAEIKCIKVRCNTTVYQIVEEINHMFRPFSGWAIISLRQEYQIKLLHYNVDIKHGERDLVLQCLGRSVAIYMQCGFCDVCDFIVPCVSSSTRGLESFFNVALDSVGRSVLGSALNK
jgi:hypothetical protein